MQLFNEILNTALFLSFNLWQIIIVNLLIIIIIILTIIIIIIMDSMFCASLWTLSKTPQGTHLHSPGQQPHITKDLNMFNNVFHCIAMYFYTSTFPWPATPYYQQWTTFNYVLNRIALHCSELQCLVIHLHFLGQQPHITK